MRKTLEANISLTTVIIMAAILLMGGLTVLISTMDLARANKDSIYYELNTFRLRSCVEEALNRLKFDHSYQGTASITFADGICSAVVTNDPGGNINLKYIAITSRIDNFYNSANKLVDLTNTPFTVTNQ